MNFNISTVFHNFNGILPYQLNLTISMYATGPTQDKEVMNNKVTKFGEKEFTLFNHQYHIFANNFNQSHWSCNLHLARFLKSFPSHQHWKAQHRSNFIWISSPNQHLSALPQILLAIDLARQIVFSVPEIKSPNTFWFFEY